MNSILLIGDKRLTDEYLERYQIENLFSPFETEYIDEIIKIEDARNIKKSLNYKTPTKKLIVFRGTLTIEAQNALLKNIEEANENIYFIFVSMNEDYLLPTIRSRCSVVRVGFETTIIKELPSLIRNICKTKGDWGTIDDAAIFLEDYSLDEIIPVLRTLLLESIDDENVVSYFHYCKKALPLLSLTKTNNINRKIAIESIFL